MFRNNRPNPGPEPSPAEQEKRLLDAIFGPGDTPPADHLALADGAIEMAQAMTGMTAALVNEGFSPEQARAMVVAMVQQAAAESWREVFPPMSARARLELVMFPHDLMTTPGRGVVILTGLPPSKRPHHVRLVAANGEILGASEMYATKAAAKRGSKAWLKAIAQIAEDTE